MIKKRYGLADVKPGEELPDPLQYLYLDKYQVLLPAVKILEGIVGEGKVFCIDNERMLWKGVWRLDVEKQGR